MSKIITAKDRLYRLATAIDALETANLDFRLYTDDGKQNGPIASILSNLEYVLSGKTYGIDSGGLSEGQIRSTVTQQREKMKATLTKRLSNPGQHEYPEKMISDCRFLASAHWDLQHNESKNVLLFAARDAERNLEESKGKPKASSVATQPRPTQAAQVSGTNVKVATSTPTAAKTATTPAYIDPQISITVNFVTGSIATMREPSRLAINVTPERDASGNTRTKKGELVGTLLALERLDLDSTQRNNVINFRTQIAKILGEKLKHPSYYKDNTKQLGAILSGDVLDTESKETIVAALRIAHTYQNGVRNELLGTQITIKPLITKDGVEDPSMTLEAPKDELRRLNYQQTLSELGVGFRILSPKDRLPLIIIDHDSEKTIKGLVKAGAMKEPIHEAIAVRSKTLVTATTRISP